jgi:cobalt-precorrin-5B (C1)-methyltransferase
VTHGALLYSQVRLLAEPGIRFVAGQGVGTVTRPGLVLAVGEPAINPVPRRMISEHLQRWPTNAATPAASRSRSMSRAAKPWP